MEENVYKFSTDRINIFSLILDCSGSMEENESSMRRALRKFKDSFIDFSEADSMAFAINTFGNSYFEAPFETAEKFSTAYHANLGGTALYGAICEGKKQLFKYMKKVAETNNCAPRATFIVFSDGEENADKVYDIDDAKEAIKDLNYAEVTTVFVAFGSSTTSKFGDELGFSATIDVEDDNKKLEMFMGEELSKSCKEQSQSLRALGSSFFSKACKDSNSEKYSQKTNQVLNDKDWFDDI